MPAQPRHLGPVLTTNGRLENRRVLDTESEQLIQASMATLLAGRTTFVIAHRLSTIRRADLILLMEEGRIVERGTHEELMRARGTYYDMVRRQMESDGRPAEDVWR